MEQKKIKHQFIQTNGITTKIKFPSPIKGENIDLINLKTSENDKDKMIFYEISINDGISTLKYMSKGSNGGLFPFDNFPSWL